MRKLAQAVLLLLFLVPGILAAQTPSDMTRDHPNGRFWLRLSSDSQLGYVGGIQDGINLLLQSVPSDIGKKVEAEANNIAVIGASIEDVRNQITIFYKDIANLPVPIIYAYVYACHKLRGESKEELEQEAAYYRKMWIK